MPRRVTVSALVVAGLFAMVALGQPPATDQKKPFGDKVKPADSADTAIAKALANDPDVQVARAKVQLAEAELAKAKQGVVLKVMTLQATIQEQKVALAAAEQRAALASQRHQAGASDQQSVLDARAKLETAKAALARTEAELKLLTGGGGKEVSGELPGGNPDTVARMLEALMLAQQEEWNREATRLSQWLVQKHAIQGPIPDRIRAALDKKVKLGTNGQQVTFGKALEIFKQEAGLDVPVRADYPKEETTATGMPIFGPDGKPLPVLFAIVSEGEELPVGAWFQLFEDQRSFRVDGKLQKWRFYVRDYGILFTSPEAAPPNAPTLTEFWKQKPPEAKKEPEPNSLEAKLERLKYQQAELSTKYGPDHPEMVTIRRQIEQLEKELKERGEQPKK